MGMQPISGQDKPEKTIYYTYKMPDDGELKEGSQLLKKESKVTGFYNRSFEGKGTYKTMNHVLISEDNVHHVIPGAKDVDAAFASDKMQKGALTEFVYRGKKQFEFKTDSGETGKASAIQCVIQQDKDVCCVFVGGTYSAKVSLGGEETPTPDQAVPSDPLKADDIPF